MDIIQVIGICDKCGRQKKDLNIFNNQWVCGKCRSLLLNMDLGGQDLHEKKKKLS